ETSRTSSGARCGCSVVLAASLRGRQSAWCAAAVPDGAPLAPRAALRERFPAPRAAGDERRARRRRAGVPGRAGGAGGLARACGCRKAAAADTGGGAGVLLPPDDLGDGRRPRSLSPPGSTADVGEGGGDAL